MMRKNNRKYYVVFFLICLFLLFAAACKKKEKEDAGRLTGTPSPEVRAEGFADANADLVKARAKKNRETVAVSVGDMEISMEKAMFLIYSMEVQGNSYAAFYQSQYGMDYWEMVYDESGRTTRDVFKEDTMNTMIQYAILHDCAVKNGIGLTQEEGIQNNAFVEEIKAALTAEEAERGGFTTENLRETCGWMMLAEKYYGKMTDSLGITKESVRAAIKKEDYKEYETEYLYLPTTYYDESYNVCQEEEEVKESRRAQMLDYYEQVLDGASFEVLAATDESLVHNVRTFLADGEQAEAAYMEAAVKLARGEVCGPVQTEYGVYIIRMVDDECTKTYEATVQAEYELRRSEAFKAAYEVLRAGYEVEVNEEVWEDIVFGATVSLLE